MLENNGHFHEMCARQKLEHSIGLEVVVEVNDVLTEGETWLSRTGGIGGLSGSDIVLSGPTKAKYWNELEKCQPVAQRRHFSACEQNQQSRLSDLLLE